MQATSRALVSPAADFWLLGGISALILALLGLFFPPGGHGFEHDRLLSLVFGAAFVVNYPHFAYSYQLFYGGFVGRLRKSGANIASRLRFFVAGIVVPVLLAGYFLMAWTTHDLGMLSDSILVMLLLVGWHYAKQGYGVLITASVYRGIFYTPVQKRLLYANAYAVWIYSWLITHDVAAKGTQYDLVFSRPVVPQLAVEAGAAAVIVCGLLAAAVLLKAWRVENKGIAWNGVVGYVCAIYLWLLLPQLLGNDAVFLVVPFFHGLQYLPFVYKYKSSEIKQAPEEATTHRNRRVQAAVFALLGVVLGGVLMDIGPKFADGHYSSAQPGFTHYFFLMTLTVFINIHHYFIDHAFWRRDNEDAQKYLFRA